MKPIPYSVFKYAKDNQPIQRESLWPDLVEYIKGPHQPAHVCSGDDGKKWMPAISGARFKPGSTRRVDNVLDLSLMLFDFDNSQEVETGTFHVGRDGRPSNRPVLKKACLGNPVLPEQVVEILQEARVAFLVYPTWSHTPEWPRFRVVLPLDEPVVPESWVSATEWVIRHLGLEECRRGIDLPVLRDVARIHFLPGGPNVG